MADTPVAVPQTAATTGADGAPSETITLGGLHTAEADTGTPQVTPPEEAVTAGETEGISVWLTNQRIVGLWTNSANKNSWVAIQGLGWRKLYNASETAVVSLTLIAAHARAENRNVNVRIEADNMVHELYVW